MSLTSSLAAQDVDRNAADQLLDLSSSYNQSVINTASSDLTVTSSSTGSTRPQTIVTRSFSTKPVAIPTPSSGYLPRKSRRGSEAGTGGEFTAGSLPASVGSAHGSGSSLMLSGMEKKKAGGGSGTSPYGMMRRESSRTSRKGSVPPTLFDFRQTDSGSSPVGSPRQLPIQTEPRPIPVKSNQTPSPLPFVPQSLPASSEVILQPGDAEDGEILDPEIIGKLGKRRKSENVFRCESCNKIYRHPSCLVKHRWQHSPHWNESSKLLLSKHQQVQVLEAATILVHLHPNSGTSLPEDKSLWPAAVSPTSHPMPSISFLDSRQVSRANSAAARGISPADISTGETSRSSEDHTSSSSPASSTEDTDPDHDHDSGYGGSVVRPPLADVKRSSPHSSSPGGLAPALRVASDPIPMNRRTSFGTATLAMGNLALGASPRGGGSGSLGGGSEHGSFQPSSFQPSRGFQSPLHSYVSSSPSLMGGYPLNGHHAHGSNGTGSTVPYGSPYGTSPALPLPSSSLRRGSSFVDDGDDDENEDEGDEDADEEEYDEEDDGSDPRRRLRYLRSSRVPDEVVLEEEEDAEMDAEGQSQPKEVHGAWDMEDMDL
ncbi:Zinc finger, C2H2 [Phaffia rhodozyma]|uniref:Zinc finger, C2H2 n=1 Tax=Phaffia rhodozyma TaxID=264483 RepID=A0A0F7SRF9_PHARH|nr:Zinc finger, C2H2 [Phaffia rhodozyma]